MKRAWAMAAAVTLAVGAAGCPRPSDSQAASSRTSSEVRDALAEAQDDDERATLDQARADIDAARRAELEAKEAELARLKAENDALRQQLAEKH